MNAKWIERQSATPEARRLYEQERLVAWATERISEAMEEGEVSRADLARLLETSRANVTALLSGARNMTLRTLADVASALGKRVEISLEPLPERPEGAARVEIPREQIGELCRRHHVRRLALFGSVLRDDFGPDSDVDVLVEFEPGYRLGLAFFGMQEELSELFGRPVDLNTAQDLSRYFREEVVHTAEVIFDAGAAHVA
jgi:predicted nucleotidyltransferase/antitoxin component HigA of HigAB toxin-antitoxin module